MTRTARYEGRPLPRPDEELVDQGLSFDLGTLVSRRAALRTLGLGAVVAGLAACGTSTGSSTASGTTGNSSGEIPDETAGPFPGDGSNGPDVLGTSGVVRSDLRTSFGGMTGTAAGVAVRLRLDLEDLADGGTPLAGAAVYVWHADQQGRYSLYSEGVTDQNYLRGVQVAGADGSVAFTTVFPACYDGRWPHVHLEVYPDLAATADSSRAVATSQVALPEDVCSTVYATPGYEASVANLSRVSLATDGVFGDDGGALQLATVSGSVADGYDVSLRVGIDTRTTPTAGSSGRGGPPR